MGRNVILLLLKQHTTTGNNVPFYDGNKMVQEGKKESSLCFPFSSASERKERNRYSASPKRAFYSEIERAKMGLYLKRDRKKRPVACSFWERNLFGKKRILAHFKSAFYNRRQRFELRWMRNAPGRKESRRRFTIYLELRRRGKKPVVISRLRKLRSTRKFSEPSHGFFSSVPFCSDRNGALP